MRKWKAVSIMLKKLGALKSLFILSLVAVVGFMATQALFIDRESSEDSSFVVGTLDMTVDGPGSEQAESLQVTGIGAQQAVSGGKTWFINNIGSLPGEFTFELSNIKNLENNCNEPEQLEDTSCGDPGDGQGELGQVITTTIKLKQDGQERTIFTSDLTQTNAQQYGIFWKNNAGKIIVPPGKTIQITLDWSTEGSQYTNSIQSDSISFDITFNLRQVLPGQAQN